MGAPAAVQDYSNETKGMVQGHLITCKDLCKVIVSHQLSWRRIYNLMGVFAVTKHQPKEN